MSRATPLNCLCLILSLLVLFSSVRGEIPLPDSVSYGRILDPSLIAVIEAGEAFAVVRPTDPDIDTLHAPVEFTRQDGEDFYVVRVPMETAIGAPGPSGSAARRGDLLESLEIGDESFAFDAILEPGGIVQRLAVGLPEGDHISRGDCNRDASVDVSDPVFLLIHLFRGGPVPGCRNACDSNDDNGLNLSDASFTLSYLFLRGARIPAPFPNCGLDPTPADEQLDCQEPCESDQLRGGGGALASPAPGSRIEALTVEVSAAAGRQFDRQLNGDLARANHAARFVAGPSGAGPLGVFSDALEITPLEIRFGAAGLGGDRTFLVENTSGSDLELTSKSLSDLFSVAPGRLAIPAGRSVLCYVDAAGERIASLIADGASPEDLVEPARVEFSTPDGTLVARAGLRYRVGSSSQLLQIESVRVKAASAAPVGIPVSLVTAEPVDSITFELAFPVDIFDLAGFAPNSGLTAVVEDRRISLSPGEHAKGSLRGRVELGVLFLAPRMPLVNEIHPIVGSSASGTRPSGEVWTADFSNGEICVHSGLLDLDLDGMVDPGIEPLAAYRFVAERADTLPESWVADDDTSSLSARAREASWAFDVDASGDFGRADLELILSQLGGVGNVHADVAARIRHIVVGEDAAGRRSTPHFGRGGQQPFDADDSLWIHLNTAEPRRDLELILAFEPPVLVPTGVSTDPRRGAVLPELVVEDLGRIGLYFSSEAEQAAAIPPGAGRLARLGLRVEEGFEGGAVRLWLLDAGRQVLDVTERVFRGASSLPSLVLSACADGRGGIGAEIATAGLLPDGLSFLHLRVEYPAGIVVSDIVGLRGLDERAAIRAHDAPVEGTLDLLVYHPAGESALLTAGAVDFLRVSFDSAGDLLDPRNLPALELTIVSAVTGNRHRALDAVVGETTPCAGTGDDCEGDEPASLDGVQNLLAFLFAGAEPPRCLWAYDADGDRRLSLGDAIHLVREHLGR